MRAEATGSGAPGGGRKRSNALVARGARVALDTLLPPACVLCGRGLPPGCPPLCRLCEARLPRIPAPRCRRCGAPSPGGPAGCAECEGWPADGPPCAAPFAMRQGAAKLVRALKYGGWEALAGPMGRAMLPAARRLAGPAGPPPLLVPVPLSAARLRERGFNQAERLAAGLSAAAGWPVAELLVRRRTGRRQARLGRRGRAANVGELFSPAPAAGPACGPALLVDDVVTTGATSAACAGALREAGSPPVGVVSFARALHGVEVP